MFRDSYYVLPVIRGQGGGLSLRGRGGIPCPLDIVQESSEVDQGIPVKFSNWKIKVAFVPESRNLNIETVVRATICIQSTYWQVGEFDEERKKYFSFFQIQKSGDDAYKFVFCPPALETGCPRCRNVGIFVDEIGVRRLALTSEPFLVVFKKANVTEISSKTM
ncbi:hypothetical protein Bca52824_084213 [Brassica carinata]|uniref:Uncharacterized protein n=1 Tax=Brassica carinata TaxID=52824 RepID=A0A8X7PN96_BRACI|nr:hypothetical protein Bca52824_084213 [Brassica carinata]